MQSENTLNVQPSWNVHDAALELLNDAIVSHNRTQPRNGDAGFTSGPNTSTEPDKEKEDTDTILKAGLSKRVFETDQDELSNSAAKRPGRKPLDEAAAKDDLDPKQKRKAQNRAAQRAFRERKEQRVNELLLKIRELEEAYNSKDIQLAKENLVLKEQLKQLEQENLALKDAQQNDSNKSTPATKSKELGYPTSYSESSGEDCMNSSSSDGYSPPSHHNQDEEDTSSSTNTPASFPLAPADITFNHVQSFQDFDFLSLPNNQTVDATLSELLHGKGDIFSNYREPHTVDDQFTHEDTLRDLFGPESDLFGFSAHAPLNLDYSPIDDNALVEKYIFTSDYQELKPEEKRDYVATKIEEARISGIPRHNIHNELIECPDFNIDLLCKDMKEKATCEVFKALPISDYDAKAYIDSFQPLH